jgi:hypothetical protein
MASQEQPEIKQVMMSLTNFALAMQGAQFLEYKLAILCTWVELDVQPRQTPPKNLERAMRPTVRRITHAFQKASASELRNRLRGKIDEGLIEDVSEMIKWRDRLAHRYLREQYVLPPPIFGQRMYDEMQALMARFEELNARVEAATEAVVAEKGAGTGDYAPEVAAMAQRLMYGDLEGGS